MQNEKFYSLHRNDTRMKGKFVFIKLNLKFTLNYANFCTAEKIFLCNILWFCGKKYAAKTRPPYWMHIKLKNGFFHLCEFVVFFRCDVQKFVLTTWNGVPRYSYHPIELNCGKSPISSVKRSASTKPTWSNSSDSLEVRTGNGGVRIKTLRRSSSNEPIETAGDSKGDPFEKADMVRLSSK